MELDDNVGKVLARLDHHGIADDTIVIFLSDNGADPYFKTVYSMYGHYQNAIDIDGKNWQLNGGKEALTEGGHRLPMMWRWPKRIQPGVDSNSLVSYIDVFATLADMIGSFPFELSCTGWDTTKHSNFSDPF